MEASWTDLQKWIILEFDRIIRFSEESKVRDIQIVTERLKTRERIREFQLLAERLREAEAKALENAKIKALEEARLKAEEEAKRSEEATLSTEAGNGSNQALENSAVNSEISDLKSAVANLTKRMDKQDAVTNDILSMVRQMWDKMNDSSSSAP